MSIATVEIVVAGPQGRKGDDGTSTQVGGLTNQVLAKQSNDDFNTAWKYVAGDVVTFNSSEGIIATNVTAAIDEVRAGVKVESDRTDAALVSIQANETAVTTATSNAATADGIARNAQTDANTGIANAATAQVTANSAVTNAATADGKAVAAQDTADIAVTDAADASVEAVAAQGTADTALSNANTAQVQADLGVTKADIAKVTADDAVTDASVAQGVADDSHSLAVTNGAAISDLITTVTANVSDITTAHTRADDAYTLAGTGVNDSATAQIQADAGVANAATAQTAANDAATAAATAQTQADAGVADAATAQSRADAAHTLIATNVGDIDTLDTAMTAVKADVVTAQGRADDAYTLAGTGVSDAGTAQTTADIALTNAATAQTRADDAFNDAGSAQTRADDAHALATTADATANTADSVSSNNTTAIELINGELASATAVTSLISVIGAIDLDATAVDVSASKVVTDYITVQEAVVLDDINTTNAMLKLTVSDGTDVDTIVVPGLYTVDTNLPFNAVTGKLEVTAAANSSTIYQQFTSNAPGGDATRYSEIGDGSDFTSWDKDYTGGFYLEAYNNTGVTLVKGASIRYSNVAGGHPSIVLANASAFDTSFAVGVTAVDIASGSVGVITTKGLLDGIDLSAFVSGDILYLSADTDGALTNVMPSIATRIGIVFNNDAINGRLFVNVDPHISLPSVFGELDDGSTITDFIADTYHVLDSFTTASHVGLTADAPNGTIGVSVTGKYRVTVNIGMVFDDIGATPHGLVVGLFNGSTEVRTIQAYLPKNAVASSFYPSILADMTAGETYHLELKCTYALANVAYSVAAFDITSVHIR